jgi:hypothetical protein
MQPEFGIYFFNLYSESQSVERRRISLPEKSRFADGYVALYM